MEHQADSLSCVVAPVCVGLGKRTAVRPPPALPAPGRPPSAGAPVLLSALNKSDAPRSCNEVTGRWKISDPSCPPKWVQAETECVFRFRLRDVIKPEFEIQHVWCYLKCEVEDAEHMIGMYSRTFICNSSIMYVEKKNQDAQAQPSPHSAAMAHAKAFTGIAARWAEEGGLLAGPAMRRRSCRSGMSAVCAASPQGTGPRARFESPVSLGESDGALTSDARCVRCLHFDLT